jgi:SsrA-binding protein
MNIINRNAFHNYEFVHSYEAGIVLSGCEVKSIVNGQCQISDAYVFIRNGEAFLLNCHISPYGYSDNRDYSPTQTRKLLLHKREIVNIASDTIIKKLVAIPTKMYFKNGKLKVEIQIGRGKKNYDKRQTLKDRSMEKEIRQQMKRKN